nr:unnamed protein product [Callosobruchus analis]
MLTTVLNDSPVFPDDEEEGENVATAEQAPLLMDSPQCVLFGTFMIWFASITINLGPTFLSGALAAPGDAVHRAPSCPLIYGPLRHYILNALWISVNLVCVFLTLFHLRKLHRDLTKANVEAVRVAGLVTSLVNVTGARGGCNQVDGGLVNGDRVRNATGALEEHRRMREYLHRMERDGVQRVKMFLVVTAAYVLFWGPLFVVTLVNHPVIGNELGHEITLHISYVHAIVNPMLFLLLHRGLRRAALDLCCGWVPAWLTAAPAPPAPPPPPPPPNINLIKTTTPVRQMMPPPPPAALLLPVPPHPDSSMGDADLSIWSPETETVKQRLPDPLQPSQLQSLQLQPAHLQQQQRPLQNLPLSDLQQSANNAQYVQSPASDVSSNQPIQHKSNLLPQPVPQNHSLSNAQCAAKQPSSNPQRVLSDLQQPLSNPQPIFSGLHDISTQYPLQSPPPDVEVDGRYCSPEPPPPNEND